MLFEAIHFGITCAKLTFGAFAPGYEHCCVSLASKKPRRVKYDQLRCRPPRRWHWPCDKTVVAERDTGESSVLMNTATDVNSTVEAGVCGLHGRRPTRTAHRHFTILGAGMLWSIVWRGRELEASRCRRLFWGQIMSLIAAFICHEGISVRFCLCLGQLSLQLRPRIGCLQGTLIVVWYNSPVNGKLFLHHCASELQRPRLVWHADPRAEVRRTIAPRSSLSCELKSQNY